MKSDVLNILLEGLDEDTLSKLHSIVEYKKIEKKSCLIPYGKKFNFICLVTQGLLRAYLLKEDGTEVIILFRKEGQFLASWESLFEDREAELIFEAIEPTHVICFKKEPFLKLLEEDKKLNKIYQQVLQKQITLIIKHLQSIYLDSAEKRYLKLKKEFPEFEMRVSVKHIAQYLGIAAPSLSRLRKRIHKKIT